MRPSPIIISLSLVLTFQSCQTSSTDFATEWTKEIKQKIIEDANEQSTRTVVDSVRREVLIFRGNKKLKYFYFKPTMDSLGRPVFNDTAVSIFFSSDQNFELVRELCPASSRSFEGLKYKGDHVGLVELRYCDGKIKERGFRYDGDVGPWTLYDTTGKIIGEIENGNSDRLIALRKIKYYR